MVLYNISNPSWEIHNWEIYLCEHWNRTHQKWITENFLDLKNIKINSTWVQEEFIIWESIGQRMRSRLNMVNQPSFVKIILSIGSNSYLLIMVSFFFKKREKQLLIRILRNAVQYLLKYVFDELYYLMVSQMRYTCLDATKLIVSQRVCIF